MQAVEAALASGSDAEVLAALEDAEYEVSARGLAGLMTAPLRLLVCLSSGGSECVVPAVLPRVSAASGCWAAVSAALRCPARGALHGQ